MDDFNEFNEKVSENQYEVAIDAPVEATEEIGSGERKNINAQMWAINGDAYSPCEKAIDTLPPGQYIIRNSPAIGIYFTERDLSFDNLIHLPDTASEEIIESIESFWEREQNFRDYGFLWKRGILLYGPPGCHAKGTEILMYDGSVKAVEDVQVGDLLMGPDSEPRKVLELKRGRENMVKINPIKGEPFVVNKSHILHLTPSQNYLVNVPINMKFDDYQKQTKCFQQRFKLTRTGVEFNKKDLKIDPYFLGLWLGDGTSSIIALTTADKEIENYWINYGDKFGLYPTFNKKKSDAKCQTIKLSHPDGRYGGYTNELLEIFRNYNLLNNKHIPHDFLTSSRSDRLSLFAGLIDSDGTINGNKTCAITKEKFGSGYTYVSKSEVLSLNVLYLARSLGYAAYISKLDKTCYIGKRKYIEGEYYHVSISGDLSDVPVLLDRKKCKPRKQMKNVLRTGFTYENLPEDNFYGFTLDKDHLYLTSDFTIHHNSGKTSTLQIMVNKLIERGGISTYIDNPPLGADGLRLLRRIEPNRPIIVVFEDIDAIIGSYGESDLLAMMDGELQIDNVVFIATTNYPERLDKRFVNRPSRFDLVKKIGMPTREAREVYLAVKNPRLANNPVAMTEWLDATNNFSIAHLKEMIVSVECLGNDFHETAERLQKMNSVRISSEDNNNPIGFGTKK